MSKLRVGVVDILSKSVSKKPYSRFMRANNQSIMPQVVAAWCERDGHDVQIAYYNGYECVAGGIGDDRDIVFINTFSQCAMVAYALSSRFRSRGAVTVVGGPHPRSYPEDSVRYFDYAVGFADQETIRDILADCAPHRPEGRFVSAARQPTRLPGVRERWKYMTPVLDQAKIVKLIPILGSLGCPYTCSFCVDAKIDYQPFDFDDLKDDLRFLVQHRMRRAAVVWHDPNFGVRFDEYLDAIEEAVPPGALPFIAESSLSLLTEPHLQRLRKNGFRYILPGIESWFDMGNKSKARSITGIEKVRQVAEHANMVTSYIPYMQGNLIFGLDADSGEESFELTKRFIDLAPAVYPHFSLLTAYGRSTALNLEYQRQNRVLPIPFHFLNQLHAMNVIPKNYSWEEIFTRITDLYEYAFSWRAMGRRFRATRTLVPKVEQLFRGISSERNHKYLSHKRTLARLAEPEVRRFLEGETTTLPAFYIDPIREDLGPLWDWLPEGAVYHNPNAYLESQEVNTAVA